MEKSKETVLEQYLQMQQKKLVVTLELNNSASNSHKRPTGQLGKCSFRQGSQWSVLVPTEESDFLFAVACQWNDWFKTFLTLKPKSY